MNTFYLFLSLIVVNMTFTMERASCRLDSGKSLEQDQLVAAIKTRKSRAVSTVIEDGCNCNNIIDGTPIFFTALSEPDISKLLFDAADLSITDGQGNTVLHAAVATTKIDFSLLEYLVKKVRMDVTAQNNEKETALHIAAKTNNKKAIELLLGAGDIGNMVDAKGQTALHVAVQHNSVDAARILLKMNVLIPVADSNKETPLDLARRLQRNDILKVFNEVKRETRKTLGKTYRNGDLKNGVMQIRDEETGYTVFHEAAHRGDLESVKTFIAGNANITIGTPNGATPLHLACQYGHKEIVQELIKAGASCNWRDKEWATSLHYAANTSLDIVDFLIEKGAFVNAKDDKGRTALHIASAHSIPGLISLLIKKGAIIEAVDEMGRTPLHIAAEKGNKSAALMLITQGGADMYAADLKGATPFTLANEDLRKFLLTLEARRKQAIETQQNQLRKEADLRQALRSLNTIKVKELLDSGINLEATDEAKNSFLHIAAQINVEFVQLLLRAGADVRARNASQQTALHLAVIKEDTKTITALLEVQADIDAEDSDKNTPLHLAIMKKNNDIALLLIKKGAKARVRNAQGVFPLHLAACLCNREVLRALVNVGANLLSRYRYTHPKDESHATENDKFILRRVKIKEFKQTEHSFKEGYELLFIDKLSDIDDVLVYFLKKGHILDPIAALIMQSVPVNKEIKLANPADNSHWTDYHSMHLALFAGNYDVTSYLINHGVPGNAVDSDGWSALHHVVRVGQTGLTYELADRGANPKMRGPQRITPVSQIFVTPGLRFETQLELFRILYRKRVDLATTTEHGKTIYTLITTSGLSNLQCRQIIALLAKSDREKCIKALPEEAQKGTAASVEAIIAKPEELKKIKNLSLLVELSSIGKRED